MARAARDELTDTAADAAIDQACRILRLPTIRDRHGEVAAAASRQQASYKGFLVELLSIEATTGNSGARPGWSARPPSPAPSGSRTSTTPPTRTCPPRSSTPRKSAWVAAGQPCCLIGDSGTGKSHC